MTRLELWPEAITEMYVLAALVGVIGTLGFAALVEHLMARTRATKVSTTARQPLQNPAPPQEVPVLEALVERVRAGETIYVTGPLDGLTGRMKLVMIDQLRSKAGMPVRVIFS